LAFAARIVTVPLNVTTSLPVSVVTGFLGSGKTTLLSRLLAHPSMGETAVIVNELGEVGIDHHLLRQVDERTVLLRSGCVCCSLRGDLADELRDLLGRRARGEIPPFRRAVVETTGLADPAPILATLLSEPMLRHQYRPESVVTTVDAVNGLRQLDRQPESLKQAAVADRLLVTKTDLVDRDALRALEERLAALNPVAPVLEACFGEIDPRRLFGRSPRVGAEHARPRPEGVEGHGLDVQAFALTFETPLDWTAFAVWLTMLLQSRGEEVLRVKGLLNVGTPRPVLLNGVQHVVHPPVHLDAWPDEDRRSRLVFIARGIEPARLEASLAAFDRAAR
jgi:G3E family GTPase